MNMLSSSLLVLALSAVAAPAFAADDGWYLGVDLGQSNYAAMKAFVTNRGQGTTATESSTATAAGLDVGYQFLRYFAVEAGYQDLGSAKGDLFYPALAFHDHLEIHAKGETLFAVGILPLSDRFSLFGKAGLLAYSLDYSDDYGLQNSYSHTTPAIGAGASYAFDDRFSLRLGLTRFHAVGNANENDRGAINLGYLQFLVHF